MKPHLQASVLDHEISSKVGEVSLFVSRRKARGVVGLGISVEILGVRLTLELRSPWRRHLSTQDHLPVDASEPLVVFDLVTAARGAAHAKTGVGTEEGPD